MRAIHKYKKSKHPEAKRRIAQSYGYRFTIHDCPRMIQLLYRAGIIIEGWEYSPSDTELLKL